MTIEEINQYREQEQSKEKDKKWINGKRMEERSEMNKYLVE